MMSQSEIPSETPKTFLHHFRANQIIHWLIKTPTHLQEATRRRSYLLAWLLLFILILLSITLIVVLIVNSPVIVNRFVYHRIVSICLVLILIAFSLNRSGYYHVAAGLTVAIAVLGPWGSMLMDPSILHGDFVPLAYISISILLSSILFLPLVTIILAIIQMVVLFSLPLISSATSTINWPSFIIYIFFTSILSILSNIISQRDLIQIDNQTRQLIQSEALLREQSIRDPLTNLFNRRYLIETLEREIQRALRE